MAEHCLRFSDRWANETLVLLGVPDEQRLKDWRRKLVEGGWNRIAVFNEPHYQNEMTALAIAGDERLESMFALLPLVK